MPDSLRVEFGAFGAAVVFKCAEEVAQDLQQLSARFPSAAAKGPTIVELDLDDLLINLGELARWPYSDVRWQPELKDLVEGVVRDGDAVRRRLSDGESASGEPTADEVLSQAGPGWESLLTSFQIRDVSKLLSLRHGANFSVPGAGKTRVALAVYDVLRRAGEVQRLLVVCPKSAYESWQNENLEVFGDRPLRMQVLGDKLLSSAEVILVNYERLPDTHRALGRWLGIKKSMLVLDEAHRMKRGPAGVYGSACLSLGPQARRRLVLTGTPAPNGVKDLENVMGFVWPGTGRQAVIRATSGNTLKQASSMLRPLFTRTTKRELGLPPVNSHVRRLTLPSLHREIYSALIGQMSARVSHSRDDQAYLDSLGRILMYLLMASTSPALLALGTTRYEPLAYQVPPLDVPEGATLGELLRDLPAYELSPKYKEAAAIVDANAAVGRKTVVWSTFVRSLTTLEKLLRPYSPAVVHGGTVSREEELKRFREDPSCFALLSNPATLGEGISLHQVCNDAVYVDRDFAAGRYLQSLDRIHRLGISPDTVTNVTVLVADGTIDELVEQRLEVKLRFMGSVLDDPAVQELGDLQEEPSVGGGMNEEDLRGLLGHLDVVSAA